MGKALDTSTLGIHEAATVSPFEHKVQSSEAHREDVGAVLDGDFSQKDIEDFMLAEGIVEPGENSKLLAIEAEFEVNPDRPSGTYNKDGQLVERGLDNPDEVA